ncbi:MAG: SDR family oxidoreductase [Acidimicrobiales bacterium]|nr:SDR family oxidoreductase [Acidimicrobiales bacterium]
MTAAAPSSDRPVAVVTGASAGLGRAIAVAFAEAGHDVGLVARGAEGLAGAAREVRARGVRALELPTDVADHEAVARAARRTGDELGPIDVWVNNAMTTVFAPSWEIEPDEFQRAVEVTFLGQVWGTMAALEQMRPRDRGAIVNVGSALAFTAIPLQSAYCSAKFAARGFFDSVRAELLHEGSNVRLSIVHMPALNTPQFGWCKTTADRHPQPVPPIYQPEEAARFVVRAATDGRRSKVVGTWNRVVVAAGRLAPGVANHFAARAAWDQQFTDRALDGDRPVNLWKPVDEDGDRGAHGIFDERAGGATDPGWLRTLPETVATLGRAVLDVARDEGRAARRRWRGRR